MAKIKEKLKTYKLRRKGWSIKSIAKKLNVSKGSVSSWCQDISLTKKQKENLYVNGLKKNLKGRLIGAEMNRQKKINSLFRCNNEAKIIYKFEKDRDLLIAGVSLYLGEGVKTGSVFVFFNSDPKTIEIIIKFLQRIMGVKKKDMKICVQINSIHKRRIQKVLIFWSRYLKIPPEQFNKVSYINIKPKKKYDNYDDYYGIVRLKVLRSSALQYKMLGLIEVLKKNYCRRSSVG